MCSRKFSFSFGSRCALFASELFSRRVARVCSRKRTSYTWCSLNRDKYNRMKRSEFVVNKFVFGEFAWRYPCNCSSFTIVLSYRSVIRYNRCTLFTLKKQVVETDSKFSYGEKKLFKHRAFMWTLQKCSAYRNYFSLRTKLSFCKYCEVTFILFYFIF